MNDEESYHQCTYSFCYDMPRNEAKHSLVFCVGRDFLSNFIRVRLIGGTKFVKTFLFFPLEKVSRGVTNPPSSLSFFFICRYRKAAKRSSKYRVVKCGASGHNVRSSPSLKAPPVGMLSHGNYVTVIDHVCIIRGHTCTIN